MASDPGNRDLDARLHEVARKAADKSYAKHSHEFQDPAYGDVLPVNSKAELADHFYQTTRQKDTALFTVEEGHQKGVTFAYNERTNTAAVFSLEREDIPPTVYRPKEDRREDWFRQKYNRAIEEQSGENPEIYHGIGERYPECTKPTEKNKRDLPEELSQSRGEAARDKKQKRSEGNAEQYRSFDCDPRFERYKGTRAWETVRAFFGHTAAEEIGIDKNREREHEDDRTPER